jgi:pimeloyl-ACP methyl ester carboxylesterase
VVFAISILTFGSLKARPWIAELWAKKYESYLFGDNVPDDTTLAHLELKASDWRILAPHKKGELLHLGLEKGEKRNKHVILFIHGWDGDYLTTWGNTTDLLNDQRLNRTYNFVFYGYESGTPKPGKEINYKPLRDLATELNKMLDSLVIEGYKTITIVSHSKGGIVTLQAVLDRYNKRNELPPHPFHRIVMFAPPTKSVNTLGFEDFAPSILPAEIEDLNEARKNINKKLEYIIGLPSHDEGRESLQINLLDKLAIIHAEKDEVVNVEDGEKFNDLLTPDGFHATASSPRFKIVENANHTELVKAGNQGHLAFFSRLEELLWSLLDQPHSAPEIDREDVMEHTRQWVTQKLHEMNLKVIDKPHLGRCWDNIDRAINKRQNDNDEDKLIEKAYYIYMFLDMYAEMDSLRKQEILNPNESPYHEWRRDWIPQLLRSNVGKWMLENDLLNYYSPELRNQFAIMARFTTYELMKFVKEAVTTCKEDYNNAIKKFQQRPSSWNQGDTYVFVLDDSGIIRFHGANSDLIDMNLYEYDDKDENHKRPFIKRGLKAIKNNEGSGWMFYKWDVPDGKVPQWKASYLEEIEVNGEKLIVGSGVYNLTVNDQLIEALVQTTVDLFESDANTLQELINDPVSYTYLDVPLFVDEDIEEPIKYASATNEAENHTHPVDKLSELELTRIRKQAAKDKSGWVTIREVQADRVRVYFQVVPNDEKKAMVYALFRSKAQADW